MLPMTKQASSKSKALEAIDKALGQLARLSMGNRINRKISVFPLC